ncbi:MFS transporter [Kribbella sp. NPDC051620]|uniref:MFS transporter n=1 Tax=Kribbella sp. NPDC051620 TaxID=3364120 RepID=UPI00379A43AC
MNPKTAEPAARTPIRWALTGLSLAMLLSSLGTSIANVALPTLADSFAASFQQVQWIVLAYLLASTTLIVSVGRLGDLTGRRRLLLTGIAVFTAASVVAGLAPTLWLLIAARSAQGLGAAIIMALAMAFIGQTVPKTRTASAMGLLGTTSAIGTALGPSLGGVLISTLGWRAIFLINLPLGLLTFALARRYLPADRGPTGRGSAGRARFDHLGTVLLTGALAAYALAMTVGRDLGVAVDGFGAAGRAFGSGVGVVGLLVVAAVGLAVFVRVESRAGSPLIRLAALRDRVLSASLGMSALVSTVMMATLVVGPFYLAGELGLKAAAVGLVLSVGPLVAALTGVPAGRVADRFGVRRMTIGGLSAIAIGAGALAALPASLGIAGYLVPIVVMTSGYATFQTANNTAVLTDLPPDQRGVVSGLLNLSRNLGLITGTALMGAVFAATNLHVTFAVAAVLIAAALTLAIIRPQAAQPAESAADVGVAKWGAGGYR